MIKFGSNYNKDDYLYMNPEEYDMLFLTGKKFVYDTYSKNEFDVPKYAPNGASGPKYVIFIFKAKNETNQKYSIIEDSCEFFEACLIDPYFYAKSMSERGYYGTIRKSLNDPNFYREQKFLVNQYVRDINGNNKFSISLTHY